MALENLTISVSARVADAQSGLASVRRATERAGDEATESSGAFSVLGNRLDSLVDDALVSAAGLRRVESSADEAGDAALLAGAKAGAATAGFLSLTLGTNGLNFSLSLLSTKIIAVAVPALALLLTTLAPLTATIGFVAAQLGGLAAGFGLVLGSGVVSGLERIKTAFQDARTAIENILSRFGRDFIPLILSAINALPLLSARILTAVGDLDRFARSLRRIGGTVADALPGAVAAFVRLGRQALPVVEQFVSFLATQGTGILQRITNIAGRLGDRFADVGQAVLDILPSVTTFGTKLTAAILPVLSKSIRLFGEFISTLNNFTESKEFAEILTAINDALTRKGFQTSLQALGENLRRIFDAIVRNAPKIIRGIVAVIDGLIDIANMFTPVIVGLIDVVGTALGLFAEGTEDSEIRGRALRPDSEQVNRLSERPTGEEFLREIGINLNVEGDTGIIREIAAELNRSDRRRQDNRVFRDSGTTPSQRRD